MSEQTTNRNYRIDPLKASEMHERYKRVKCNILSIASGIKETESFWMPIKELRELLEGEDISGVRFYLSAYENGIETNNEPKNRLALSAFATKKVDSDAKYEYEKHRSDVDTLTKEKSTKSRSTPNGVLGGPFPPPPPANQ